ncbi:MAG: acyl-CoA thioesterase/bile acid-CoA:amino acid N-acyltransferase family protein [Pseudomonadota bacterium]
MKRLSAAFALLTMTACQTVQDPALNVTSAPILQGDPVEITLTNLEPGLSVTLTLEEIKLRRGAPAFYTSTATFTVPEDGTLNTATSAPVSGSYEGVDQAGLFWSRRRPDDQQPTEDTPLDPLTLTVDLASDGTPDFIQDIDLITSLPEVEPKPLGEDFPGAIYATPPAGEGSWPVLFIFGGSEGHDTTAKRMTPIFASRGYFAVGVPYHSPAWGDQPQRVPGLPKAFANIDVAYLETVMQAVAEMPGADMERVGLWGVSKGAEYVLIAGERIEGIDAIAAIVPTDVVWEGWGAGETVSSFAWRGEPLPFVPYEGMAEEFQKETPQLVIPHEAGRKANPDRVEPARIRVETIDEPVFLVGGDADTVWASGPMARKVKATRDAAGLETEIYTSESAGHYLSGDGYAPAFEPEAKVKTVAWPAMLAFFETHLASD